MVDKILNISEKAFDSLKRIWESTRTNKLTSNGLAVIFVVSVILSYLDRNHSITMGKWDQFFANPFFAIEISFTLLLILELLSLIFVLPKSVARSVSKQFEVLSLIFIRSGFKEFSHIEDFNWEGMKEPLLFIATYAIGALIIFVIIGFSERIQRHVILTNNEDEQREFIQLKKMLSLFLILAFLTIGVYDITELFKTGLYHHSFHAFYTVLIFSDIIIVLVALRYTLNYYKIFRYSAFVLATIAIRMALSVKPVYDVVIGVSTSLFVFLLTIFYNHFIKNSVLITETKDQEKLT